jgi:hypothetical protein
MCSDLPKQFLGQLPQFRGFAGRGDTGHFVDAAPSLGAELLEYLDNRSVVAHRFLE